MLAQSETPLNASDMLFTSYLSGILIHASFPLLLFATDFFHPLVVIGPVANYVFLRYVGGDRENEANQKERYQVKNWVKVRATTYVASGEERLLAEAERVGESVDVGCCLRGRGW
jgi:hypothetical protein